jgi:serine/threonine-protein kinase
MGVVYHARDQRSGGEVALKVVAPHLVDPEILERFRQEARAASRLRHPGIVAVLDVGEAGGQHYIAFQYIKGESLSAVVARHRQGLPLEQALSYAHQIAEALACAHRCGVVHRDIKPPNVLVGADGRCHLTDFGIARVAARTTMTRTGMVLGTPSYMSPEQASGGKVDSRSDIYSLGVVLFELLSGDVPFHGEDSLSVLFQHIERPAPSLSSLRPDLPAALVRIVARCLEKDPEKRFASAEELAANLKAAAEDLQPAPLHLRLVRTLGVLVRSYWSGRSPAARRWHVYGALIFFCLVLPFCVTLEAVTRPEGGSPAPPGPSETFDTSAPARGGGEASSGFPFAYRGGQEEGTGPPAPVPTSAASAPTPAVTRATPSPGAPPPRVATNPVGAPPGPAATGSAPARRPAASRPVPAGTLTPASPTPLPQRTTSPRDGSTLVLVPAGPFSMGDNRAHADEAPAHTVEVGPFYVDEHEVTVEQFRRFLEATGYQPEGSAWDMFEQAVGARAPVVNVSWADAQRYADWAGRRLPTEAEWEKAARGSSDRVYPWGNSWDPRAANWGDLDRLSGRLGALDGREGAAAVGSFPWDTSPCGARDLAGNVREWTADWYRAYPGNDSDNPYYGQTLRVVRGGSWEDGQPDDLRGARRRGLRPEQYGPAVGFRTVMSP